MGEYSALSESYFADPDSEDEDAQEVIRRRNSDVGNGVLDFRQSWLLQDSQSLSPSQRPTPED